MKPILPWVPGNDAPNGWQKVVFAKDQPPYIPLPAILERDGTAHTCWHLSVRERIQAFFGGKVYLSLLTFNEPLQPIRMSTEPICLLAIGNR